MSMGLRDLIFLQTKTILKKPLNEEQLLQIPQEKFLLKMKLERDLFSVDVCQSLVKWFKVQLILFEYFRLFSSSSLIYIL